MLKLKKLLSVALAVVMIATMALTATFTSTAKDFTDVAPDNAFSSQIDMLSDIGVIKGTTDTEFSPKEKVTREQMALLLYRLMTGKDNSGRVNTSPFIDLYEPSYNGAISWAYSQGYILGVSANRFDPTGGITLQDAIAMVTRALGQTNDKTNAGYPWSYIEIGTRLGLTENLEKVDYEQILTRAETAALLYNAITADYIIVKNVSGINVPVVTSVLEHVYGFGAGTAFITATNSFALPSTASVIRNGYAEVDILDENGNVKNAYIKQSDLDVAGDINEYIGESFKVFYKINSKTGIADILGATPDSYSKNFSSFTVGGSNAFIQIDGVKYNVVENYSASTATNANELLVFAFDEDGTLAQISTNAALAEKNGFFNIKMIYENGSEIASRAIFMPLTHAELDINAGIINIAGGLKAEQLTGGFINYEKAVDGDRVLYYFNDSADRLVIAEKLGTVKNALLSRLTSTSAVIGGKAYTLGVPGTAFTAESVAALLTVGERFDIVTRGNALIDATPAQSIDVYDSTYLIAMSTGTPVVHKDQVCYFMTANIAGKNVNVYVNNAEVVNGNVYRYEADENGILTLIAADNDKFAQTGELKTLIGSASSATIAKGGNVYYTLTNGGTTVSFVTDKNTVIAVKTASGIIYKTGAYASEFTVNDGAQVVAIMNDNQGSIETLKYLYISSGDLGGALDSSSFVKVLDKTASEQVGSSVMSVYTVYNFASGKVEQLYSSASSLTEGSIYMLNENGHITENTKSLESGTVNGYTQSTITIDSGTYKFAPGLIISGIETNASGEFVAKTLSVSDVYGLEVSFVLDGNQVTRILVNN